MTRTSIRYSIPILGRWLFRRRWNQLGKAFVDGFVRGFIGEVDGR